MTDFAHPKEKKAFINGVLWGMGVGVGLCLVVALGLFVYSYRVALTRAVKYKSVVESTDEKLFQEASVTKFEVKK